MSVAIFILEPIKLHELLKHLNNIRLDFKIIGPIISLTMLDSARSGWFSILDMVLYGSMMFSDYTSYNSTPNSSTLCLILTLRF